MSDEDKTFSGSFVLDLRIWWRQAHTLYTGTTIVVCFIPVNRSLPQPFLVSSRNAPRERCVTKLKTAARETTVDRDETKLNGAS